MNDQNQNVNNQTTNTNGTVLGVAPNPTLNPQTPQSNQTIAATPVVATPVSNVASPQPTLNPAPEVVNPTPSVVPVSPEIAAQTMQQPVAPAPQPASPTPDATTVPEPVEPVATPIPGTEGLTGTTVTSGGVMPTGSTVLPQGNSGNIGTVPPPVNPNEKDPKKFNKILFIAGIVVLIGLIAFGVYFFLNKSNSTVKLTLKTLELGVGDILSDNISDYATITGGDTSNCVVNKRNVTTLEAGEYTFSITCGKQTFDGGKVVVKDTIPPQALLNTVFKWTTNEVTLDDFVVSCEDTAKCEVSFVSEDEFLENSKKVGSHQVGIKAVDGNGNEKEYETTMYVTEFDIQAYRKCNSEESSVVDFSAKKVTQDIFPIGNNGDGWKYLGYSIRNYRYVFDNDEEYYAVVGNKDATITFDNVTGLATYIDNKKTLVITTDLSINALNSENGGNFPTDYAELTQLYDTKNYTCSNTGYTAVIDLKSES